jgi:hypothetical protein
MFRWTTRKAVKREAEENPLFSEQILAGEFRVTKKRRGR